MDGLQHLALAQSWITDDEDVKVASYRHEAMLNSE